MNRFPATQKPPKAGGSSRAGIAEQERVHYADICAYLEDFRAFIQAEYKLYLVGDLRADGEFHGMASTDDKHGAKPFRYCVHLDNPQNIYFTDLKRGASGVWYPQGQETLDPIEREKQRREFDARRAQREQETAKRHTKAAERARALWRRSLPVLAPHPYLTRKGVQAHGLRFLPVWEHRIYQGEGSAFETVKVEGVLLVSMKDASGALWNLQAIFPEACPALGRDKDFLPGGRKRGLFHWLGEHTETVCLAEGYATAASLHEATGYRVFVSFDAGNLPEVAKTVREMLPTARIVVCGDNDTPDPRGRRAGQEKASEAAALVRGYVALPPVEGADFNDFAAMLREQGYGR
ncbi:MAG: toprim domain-containing protein [Methylococcaceae bacterium]|nr:toprim domain-containing protein [Methylococcaceae bacterium]